MSDNHERGVQVRINDRAPFAHGRIIDLSRKAAESLDMIRPDVVLVRVESMRQDGGLFTVFQAR